MTIKNWNQLPAEASGTFPRKPKFFREENNYKRGEAKVNEMWRKSSKSEVK
jgi:hypothetical protein